MIPPLDTCHPFEPVPAELQRLVTVRDQLLGLCRTLDAQIRRLQSTAETAPKRPCAALFERPPALAHVMDEPAGRVVLPPVLPEALEPEFKETALSELNLALTRAFNEVTHRAAA